MAIKGRGGKRPGAGRKKGVPNKATQKRRDVALRALEDGKTPLDVLLEAMKDAYGLGGAIAATPYAKEAAPYVHPKLAAIEAELSGKDGVPLERNLVVTFVVPQQKQ